MKISSAKYEGGRLILETADMAAKRFPYNFKPGNYQLIKKKAGRSLDANRLMWEICTRIGNEIGISKDDVYRAAIRDGNEFAQFWLDDGAVAEFSRVWAAKGTGWVVEIKDKLDGKSLVFAYYGSSTYSTGAMSALIDRLIQDAKNIGIEVISERERSLLEALDGRSS